jgi:hypothetical protein
MDASLCGGRLQNSNITNALYHIQIQHNKVKNAVLCFGENNIPPQKKKIGMLIWTLEAYCSYYKHSLTLYKHNGKI